MSHLPPNKRNVNIVFQDYALFPHLSVARNIAFGLELKGMDSASIDRASSSCSASSSSAISQSACPTSLSGGQRQRVALMRALGAGSGRPAARRAAVGARRQAAPRHADRAEAPSSATTGKTFIFVTHDQEEALTMSDVIVVMNNGRIEQMGSA
ncbi:MAG: ATP-binding cassette domain-containing protein [Micropruina sp.]|uniref:ATP-binding cassette domain-containing protein n=1 Tax=Micropruina sp. TaxID=2737536 RepID=UPI0039E37C13